jgi:hypothetical protein
LRSAWTASPSRVVADSEVPTKVVTVVAVLIARMAWLPVS